LNLLGINFDLEATPFELEQRGDRRSRFSQARELGFEAVLDPKHA
jgi:hypothetical protein